MRPSTPKTWVLRHPAAPELAADLAARLGVSDTFARLLANRGFTSAEQVESFLAPSTDKLLDPFVLYYLGSITTVAALIYTTVTKNRDVRHAAPWNSAIYLDLNADLIRRNSPVLAFARKEFVPQEKPFKTPKFYYALARKIESHGFDAELMEHLSTAQRSREEVRAASPG